MNPAPPLRTIADIEHLLEAHADLHALLLHYFCEDIARDI
jgi:hypothetical protein